MLALRAVKTFLSFPMRLFIEFRLHTSPSAQDTFTLAHTWWRNYFTLENIEAFYEVTRTLVLGPIKLASVLLNGFTKQLQFIAFHQHRLAVYPFPRDFDRKDELTSDSIHSNKYQENFTVKHPQEIHFKIHFFVVERSREKNP